LSHSLRVLAWTTSLEEENMASALVTDIATAIRAQATIATTLEAVHRLDNAGIIAESTMSEVREGGRGRERGRRRD